MKIDTTKKVISLSALIAVTPALYLSALSTELQKPPAMSVEDKKAVGQAPEINPKWTWMTADHATHIFKSSGHANVEQLQRNEALWQIPSKSVSGKPLYHVVINRYGEVRTQMRQDIAQRWAKFSREEVLALENTEDLIEKIHIKYGISTKSAADEVESFEKERSY